MGIPIKIRSGWTPMTAASRASSEEGEFRHISRGVQILHLSTNMSGRPSITRLERSTAVPRAANAVGPTPACRTNLVRPSPYSPTPYSSWNRTTSSLRNHVLDIQLNADDQLCPPRSPRPSSEEPERFSADLNTNPIRG
ncbi:uncharacterized protein SCHCODRAFT_02308929 [Schizophyllum commune H4-8]|uniref:uncharacterized protein n=1 Tax=Schizophyllum commune (strain H4-8 / FGSC 9210) TaxID=578458 RepID=UPI002160E354|nr:uncharacterized protein SCHCODRAFT_02308929 [Schizophyllum commune H4-8]KAI5891028.1 hypothetical protein SCHCODRAFT_02308929 [Schizophyllum commune H4-8]